MKYPRDTRTRARIAVAVCIRPRPRAETRGKVDFVRYLRTLHFFLFRAELFLSAARKSAALRTKSEAARPDDYRQIGEFFTRRATAFLRATFHEEERVKSEIFTPQTRLFDVRELHDMNRVSLKLRNAPVAPRRSHDISLIAHNNGSLAVTRERNDP